MMRGWLVLLGALSGCDVLFRLDELSPPPEPGSWEQLAAGESHSCAVRLDGSLWCWGQNDHGQLGLGVGAGAATTPTRVGAASWQAVSSWGSTTCAIQADGSLWCWGANKSGQVGNGTILDQFDPVPIPTPALTAVVVGGSHTCVLAIDGVAYCWGDNLSGQLGLGSTTLGQITPGMPVTARVRWMALTAGQSHVCALATDGGAWCWGSNSAGQLGLGLDLFTSPNKPAPEQVSTQTWSAIAAGGQHTCGVLTDGRFRCWGQNQRGQLAIQSVAISRTPVAPDLDVPEWTAIAAGTEHTCATKRDGSLWCWGSNGSGQSGGTAGATYGPQPTMVTGGAFAWARLALGFGHTCGIGSDHNLWCFGVAATGGATRVLEPTQVEGSWLDVSAGGSTTCAIDATGALACWGNNGNAQLGDSTYVMRTAPKKIAAPTWTAVSVGDVMACAIRSPGGLACWGSSGKIGSCYEALIGGIGDGSETRTTPTPIAEPRTFRSVATGTPISLYNGEYCYDTSIETHSCAIEAGTNQLFCWGSNASYELGTGTGATLEPSPVPVAGAQSWTMVGVGNYHTCGIANNQAQCWGSSYTGQLGLGGAIYSASTPTVVGSFSQVFANGDYSCGVTSDGIASCWGSNYYGQLGNGSTVPQFMPVAIAGTWSELALGPLHACGIGLDHSLWCWGVNASGQLGDGTQLGHSVPMRIGSETSWLHATAGTSHTCATRTDQSLWCWGDNTYGQIGIGALASSNAPVLIP